MKNNKNLKIKVLLSLILLVIMSAVTYISLPYISYALENAVNNSLENVKAITFPESEVTMDKEQIHEHRGYKIWAGYVSKTEKKTYENATGNTGISDINSYIATYLSPKIAIDKSYGWLWSLQYGTSIFCQESGRTFPSLNGRKLFGFHLKDADSSDDDGSSWIDTNEDKYPGDSSLKYTDFSELIPDLACPSSIKVQLVDYKGAIEPKKTAISEKDILDTGASGYGFHIKNFTQKTTVRVEYKAHARNFDTIESYIFTYSLRNWYTYNPAQYALWKYKNNAEIAVGHYAHSDQESIDNGLKLYKAAKAVNELSNPVKPEMSKTSATVGGLTYETGTVLDGEYYKVGPIKMNSYSYGWTENVKPFSGESSIKNPLNKDLLDKKDDNQKEFFKGIVAGIIEARVKLDNIEEEIILDKDNFIIEDASVVSGSEFYSCPTMADGYEYPTPGSTFYIKLPIADCVGATKIEKVTMKYKWHTADGNGGDLLGQFDELTWQTWKDDGTQERLYYNTTQYYCTNHDGDGTACTRTGYIRSCYAKVTNAEDKNGNEDSNEVKNGDIDYNINAWSHYFNCGETGWCQYGSSTGSTSSKEYTYSDSSGKSETLISDKCSYTWTCGYNAHRCDNNYSDYEIAGGSVKDGCVCPHKHSDSCFELICTKGNGVTLICGKSEHDHDTDVCNTKDCDHKPCDCKPVGNSTSVTCKHKHDEDCCDKEEHDHKSKCYHYHTDMDGSCYKRICGHTNHGGRYNSGETGSCVKLPGTCKYKGKSNTEYATHVHTSSCSRSHDCTKNYCIHGFANSNHSCGKYYVSYTDTSSGDRNKMHPSTEDGCSAKNWGDDHIGRCYGELGVGTKCVAHGVHRNCMRFYWYLRKQQRLDSQKLMYVSDAQVYEHNEECYIGEIPLITKIEIDKYIYDVKHAKEIAGVADDTFGPSDERRELDEETKSANPVYVESDDYVTYKVIMKNSSKFAVKIKVDDILPADGSYEFISADLGYKKIEDDIAKLRNETIQVDAEKEATITITLQVKALKGKYENKARIITRNGTSKNSDNDIDYIRTVDDDGPIVNHIETTCQGNTNTPDWESSDWFILNNYNTFIDKYVYKYNEVKRRSNNNMSITNEESVVGSGYILDPSRLNEKTTFEEIDDDGNLKDKIRVNNMTKDKDENEIAEHELYKREHPVNVEKNEYITYAIRVYNDASLVENTEDSGNKTPTKVKISSIEDKLHVGLTYQEITAKICNTETGAERVPTTLGVSCSKVKTEGNYNIYNITTSNDLVIEPGEYIEFYVKTKVVQSNMYLFDLDNEAKIKEIKNINDIDVTERNISKQDVTTEHLRMKDLVISGKVWVDFNRDGVMNDKPRDDFEAELYSVDDAAMKEGVEVRLYRVDSLENATQIRTTRTNSEGLYTFAKGNSWYPTYNHTKTYVEGTDYQRIDKANNKDANGNYTAESQYYKYYVEFAYDGVIYRSTVYAGTNNINADGTMRSISSDTELYGDAYRYKRDSNATELDIDRENFNKKYVHISYDSAFDINKANGKELEFKKLDHESYLIEDPSREITAKSFVMKHNSSEVLAACQTAKKSCGAAKWKSCSNHYDEWQVVIGMGLIDDSAFPNTEDGRKQAQAALEAVIKDLQKNTTDTGDTQKIKYLWLYSYNESIDNKIPETEYLKYINLGLSLRGDVDLAISKDVYSVTTTINGEEMEYMFNKGDTDAYRFDKSKTTEPYNTVRKPYAFEMYESDYKYRVEQYLSDVVEKYKGLTEKDENGDGVIDNPQKFGTDELTVEVTYRINLQNRITKNDAYLVDMDQEIENIKKSTTLSETQKTEAIEKLKEEKLSVKVHDVLDVYDANFVDLSEGPTIPVMIKDGDKLKEGTKKVVEAWTYVGGTKVNLSVNTESAFDDVSKNPVINSTDKLKQDGYKKLFISGMGDIKIAEGDNYDIYVKYVVDKDALTIEMDENAKKVYEETKETTSTVYESTTNTVEIKDIEDPNIDNVIYSVTDKKERTTLEGKKEAYFEATMRRALKIAEKANNGFKTAEKGGRGTENIAQINTYSVWYADGKPVSIVDKDSNAGNIGITPTGTTSLDNTKYYEDMVYKTGIELIAEGSENSKRKITEKYDDEWQKEDRQIEIVATFEPVRKITGTVWDDARSNVVTEETDYTSILAVKDAQFIGNGKYDSNDVAYKEKVIEDGKEKLKIIPKLNEAITEFYGGKKEEKDIPVRNVKAEYIEIVPIEKDGVTKYYEEVLSSVTWEQEQSTRTEGDGTYTLTGFKPGNYIVRFTYGDTVNAKSYGKAEKDATEIEKAKADMQLFNGQDYKSTQYKGISNDITNVDDIINGIERKGVSDARDDEVRRLEVNSYSEIMTNDIAEILKGRSNGNEKLTPTSKANLPTELETLTDNTYMFADTREFLVRTEKLTDEQKLKQKAEGETYVYSSYEEMINGLVNDREFKIENVDFGIEYRPESQISLIKEIKQVTLITESNETLVDIHFDTISTPANKIEHVINEEKSIGFDKVKLVTNYYTDKTLINNIISEEHVQGLAYLEVDEELLQGATIKITYGFNAQNCSEVDRISKKLDSIRYRDNEVSQTLSENYQNKFKGGATNKDKYLYKELGEVVGYRNETTGKDHYGKYTASGLARIPVFDDFYNIDETAIEGTEKYIVYRTTPKDLTTTGNDKYYGRYVGYGYYTGNMSELDTIASLKFDKILDYIDTGLEYEDKTEAKDVENKLWSKITSVELVSLVSQYKDIRDSVKDLTLEEAQAIQNTFTEILGKDNKAVTTTVNGIELKRTIDGDNVKILINGNEFDRVKDIDGIEYKSMVVSVNDRNIDDPEYGEAVSPEMQTKLDAIKNKDLSRFLVPKVTAVGLDGTDDAGKENDKLDTATHDELGYEDYTGHVYLDVSKVLASGANNGDYTYENMAEVVQFTTLTGRRTNFATTIGNANIHEVKEKLEKDEPPFKDKTGKNSGSIEFITASLEPDTSATETITLTPPTGLMKNRRAIVSIMETAKAGVEVMSMTGLVVAIVAGIGFLVILAIRKYKKRRIK